MTKVDTEFGKFPTWADAANVCAFLASDSRASEDARNSALREINRMGALLDEAKADPTPEPTEEQMKFISPISQGMLEPYDTVLGYLAKVHPETLEFDAWDPEATQRDGFWLTHRCRERGIQSITVPAPRVMVEQGIRTVKAYPVSLLEERLGGRA